jgi:hypothetical protein
LTGGSRNTIGRNGTSFNISSNDLGISTQRDDKAKSIDNKFGAINIAQQMSKTGILVVSEYFLQIKQYRTHRRESEYSNSTAIKQMKTGLI